MKVDAEFHKWVGIIERHKKLYCGEPNDIPLIPKELLPKLAKKFDFIKDYIKGKPCPEIFEKTKAIFKKYLDTTEVNYTFLTIWTLGTYFHSQFETYPLLLLLARKQSGKTRTLKLVSTLSAGSDGSVSTSITETFLFRHREGAVFFDEMESLSSENKTALRELLNATYKRGNKIVRYKEKKVDGEKTYVEDCFYPFYPVGLANIYGFGDVLEDRSIQLILQRSKNFQSKLIEDFSTNQEIKNLKKELEKLNAEIPQNLFSEWNSYVSGGDTKDLRLKSLFEVVSKTELSGRPLEKLFPLFVVGEIFGVLDEVVRMSTLIELVELNESWDDLLFDYLSQNFEKFQDYVPLSSILSGFRSSLENPSEKMNSKWLGYAIKRLGFIKKKRLVNGKVQVMLSIKSSIGNDGRVRGFGRVSGGVDNSLSSLPKDSKKSLPLSTSTTTLLLPTNSTTKDKEYEELKKVYEDEGLL